MICYLNYGLTILRALRRTSVILIREIPTLVLQIEACENQSITRVVLYSNIFTLMRFCSITFHSCVELGYCLSL